VLLAEESRQPFQVYLSLHETPQSQLVPPLIKVSAGPSASVTRCGRFVV
jgi:hypothetical protein